MTYIEFVKAKKSSPFYIISGEEEYLKDKIIELVSAKKQKITLEEDVTMERLFDELYTPDLAGSHKVIVIKDSKGFLNKNEEALAKYAESPSTVSTLAILCGKSISIKGSLLVECARSRKPDLVKWAQASFSKRGVNIEERALGELVTRNQGSLRQLEQEIEKLSSFSKTIALEDVLVMSQDESTAKVFDMASLTAKSDRNKALLTLHKLVDQGESIQMILATLAWQFRKMVELSRKIEMGEQPYQAAISLGIKFNPYDFINAVKGISTKTLERKLGLILDADILLKTSQLGELAVMDSLIVKLCI